MNEFLNCGKSQKRPSKNSKLLILKSVSNNDFDYVLQFENFFKIITHLV